MSRAIRHNTNQNFEFFFDAAVLLRVCSLGDDIEGLGDSDVVGEDNTEGEMEGEAEEGGAGAGADKEPADSGYQLANKWQQNLQLCSFTQSVIF